MPVFFIPNIEASVDHAFVALQAVSYLTLAAPVDDAFVALQAEPFTTLSVYFVSACVALQAVPYPTLMASVDGTCVASQDVLFLTLTARPLSMMLISLCRGCSIFNPSDICQKHFSRLVHVSPLRYPSIVHVSLSCCFIPHPCGLGRGCMCRFE